MTVPSIEPTNSGQKRSWRNIIIMIFAGVGFVVVACCVIAAFIKKPTATTEVPPTPNKVTQATAAVAPGPGTSRGRPRPPFGGDARRLPGLRRRARKEHGGEQRVCGCLKKQSSHNCVYTALCEQIVV